MLKENVYVGMSVSSSLYSAMNAEKNGFAHIETLVVASITPTEYATLYPHDYTRLTNQTNAFARELHALN